MKLRQWTVVILGINILFLIVYDLFVVHFGQDGDTISEVVNLWGFKAAPLTLVSFGAIVGGLMVHFFQWKPNNSCSMKIKEKSPKSEDAPK